MMTQVCVRAKTSNLGSALKLIARSTRSQSNPGTPVARANPFVSGLLCQRFVIRDAHKKMCFYRKDITDSGHDFCMLFCVKRGGIDENLS